MKIIGKKLFGLVRYKQSDVIRAILESTEAKQVFDEVREKKNQSLTKSKTKARKILEELTSSYNIKALSLSYWIVNFLQKRMFDGIAIHGDGLNKARELSKEGKILFLLPNHKSHLDYLLISYILFNYDIAPPHIASGVNLSFWPMGPIFRNTGAYFIRRKIAGNFLYTRFLELYFDWMLRERISQEFYMEGGRSRNGKIREAQSGIFTLFIDQILLQKLSSEAYIIPTTITYDRVPEMKSLLFELKGSHKKKENAFSLFASLPVLFQKHGQVHLNFGDPIQLKSLVKEEFSKKDFSHLSTLLFQQIQKQKTITLSSALSLVLLSSNSEVDSQVALTQINQVIRVLAPCQSCMSETLVNVQKNWDEMIRKFIQYGWIAKSGDSIFIPESKRLEMNYYKNDILPFFIPFWMDLVGKDCDEQERIWIQRIMEHEYPYADFLQQKCPPGLENLVREAFRPLVMLYLEILRLSHTSRIQDFVQTDSRKIFLHHLQSSDFLYEEVKNEDSVVTASMFFHQHTDELQTKSEMLISVLEKIKS